MSLGLRQKVELQQLCPRALRVHLSAGLSGSARILAGPEHPHVLQEGPLGVAYKLPEKTDPSSVSKQGWATA